MPASLPDKAQLRARMRERRRALTAAAQHTAAEAAAHNATGVPGWERASRIAVYLASDGEIDTTPLARFCRNTGKQLLLPVITADRRLDFYFWNEGDQLFPNRFGIPEPATTATRCAVGELDIIVMPLVAWDRTGTRLGMGGGFYDRTLMATTGPLKVGLAHALQEVARLPRDDWDVAMDFVATDSALRCCRVAAEDVQS